MTPSRTTTVASLTWCFMVHDPAYGKAYKPGDGKVVTDYDAGIQAQKDALK